MRHNPAQIFMRHVIRLSYVSVDQAYYRSVQGVHSLRQSSF